MGCAQQPLWEAELKPSWKHCGNRRKWCFKPFAAAHDRGSLLARSPPHPACPSRPGTFQPSLALCSPTAALEPQGLSTIQNDDRRTGLGKGSTTTTTKRVVFFFPRLMMLQKATSPGHEPPFIFIIFQQNQKQSKRHNKGRSKPTLLRLFSASFTQIFPHESIAGRRGLCNKVAPQTSSGASSFCGDEGDCCRDAVA